MSRNRSHMFSEVIAQVNEILHQASINLTSDGDADDHGDDDDNDDLALHRDHFLVLHFLLSVNYGVFSFYSDDGVSHCYDVFNSIPGVTL
ncbi:hypothetical protein QVD17_21132 [Tagetes erecta]|uniref:Uncharacterized protein n=1 Tax=Tagetes erecta TaxID=13708 RepID=A0AAD8KMI3_TARER|nr:hypothetical protein QVD17_21132 [Tagetes erecta]